MKIGWTFRNCDLEMQRAKEYFSRKIPRLRRRLSRFGLERSRLDLTLYYHRGSEVWELRAVLKLPTRTLVTVDEQASLTEVIDEVIDDLTGQLRRHKARVRKEHITRRRRRRGRDFVTALSYLEQDVALDRRDEFFALLSPLLENIREHAKYELKMLENENAIPIGELSVDELVDEVLVLSYDRFKLRPPQDLMEIWLMGLLHERIDALTAQVPPLAMSPSVELSATEEDDDSRSLELEDVNFWMSHVFEHEEAVGLEELLPDDRASESLSEIESGEGLRQLKQCLNRLPRRQRQAIMLHEASGFEISEIANMLELSDLQVEDLIGRARETLRRNLADLARLTEAE